MTLHTKVEATETIPRQTVSTTLEDDGFWIVIVHDTLNDWLEYRFVGLIVDAVSQRKIDRVIFTGSDSYVAKLAGTGKVLAVFVK
jgi:hypothetical protein